MARTSFQFVQSSCLDFTKWNFKHVHSFWVVHNGMSSRYLKSRTLWNLKIINPSVVTQLWDILDFWIMDAQLVTLMQIIQS